MPIIITARSMVVMSWFWVAPRLRSRKLITIAISRVAEDHRGDRRRPHRRFLAAQGVSSRTVRFSTGSDWREVERRRPRRCCRGEFELRHGVIRGAATCLGTRLDGCGRAGPTMSCGTSACVLRQVFWL